MDALQQAIATADCATGRTPGLTDDLEQLADDALAARWRQDRQHLGRVTVEPCPEQVAIALEILQVEPGISDLSFEVKLSRVNIRIPAGQLKAFRQWLWGAA